MEISSSIIDALNAVVVVGITVSYHNTQKGPSRLKVHGHINIPYETQRSPKTGSSTFRKRRSISN